MKQLSRVLNLPEKVELEVVGLKQNLKFEKKLVASEKLHRSVELIQRVWRGHGGRKIAQGLRETKATVVI